MRYTFDANTFDVFLFPCQSLRFLHQLCCCRRILVTFPLLAALMLFLDQFAVTFSLRWTNLWAVRYASVGSRNTFVATAYPMAPNHKTFAIDKTFALGSTA